MSESQVVMGFQAVVAVAAGLVETCGVLTILLGVALALPAAVRAHYVTPADISGGG